MDVLIVEDDPSSRLLLEKAIRSFGYQACPAASGEEAWERFSGGNFDFVITDWVMPGMDGLELCRHIRNSAHPNYVYVIMVTSRDSPEDLITGMDAGADDFIVRPIQSRELQVRMRAAERILKLQQQLREKNQELAVANTRLRRLSRRDALMRIGNRLAFEERIAEFHDRATRYGDRYGVVMCDVDHFKSYNDSHGHPAGDEALRRVAAAIKNCLRASDSAFRYGGEELVILLPEQPVAETVVVAERVRAVVESTALGRGRLTLSCGVAGFPAPGRPLGGWENVVELADQALYRAKALGRNRVELAEAWAELSAA